MTAELIERLERGETGREIDAIIYVALFGGKVIPRAYMEYENGVPMREVELMTGIAPVKTEDGWQHPAAGPYTTSLDAAIALVERVRPESSWTLRKHPDYLPAVDFSKNYMTPHIRSEAPTPAAALIAALLKAEGK